MDAVSLETPQENEFVKQRIVRGKRLTTKYKSLFFLQNCNELRIRSSEGIFVLVRFNLFQMGIVNNLKKKSRAYTIYDKY